MTNEIWIRTKLTAKEIAKLLLYHDSIEEFDYNFVDELEFVRLKDIWMAHDGREFESLEDAVCYEVDWLSHQHTE